MADLAIKSDIVVTSTDMRPAVVLIKGSKIEAVTSEFPADENCRLVDLGKTVLMPGLIDPHVHINEPGRTHWEGFETATRSALHGGITSLVDMPLNSSPVTTTVSALRAKRAVAGAKLQVNCGFWGGIVPGNANEIAGLASEGVMGFKAFLTHSGIDEFPDVKMDDLRKAMPLIADCKLPLLVHAELSTGSWAAEESERKVYKQYLSSRPPSWENEAIAMMIRLCEEYNCHVHIVHLSSADSIEQLIAARKRGLNITVETAPHYLYFSAEEILDGETVFKCAPPIRERLNNELLWEALTSGVIDFVATDHSPAPPEMKALDNGDFSVAWGGIASLQFSLPVVWTLARNRNAGLRDINKWMSAAPAILIGKDASKGKIEKGFDADLVAWATEKKFTVTENIIQHKHKVTPYLGCELYGEVQQVWISGELAFHYGEITGEKHGKFLTRD